MYNVDHLQISAQTCHAVVTDANDFVEISLQHALFSGLFPCFDERFQILDKMKPNVFWLVSVSLEQLRVLLGDDGHASSCVRLACAGLIGRNESYLLVPFAL